MSKEKSAYIVIAILLLLVIVFRNDIKNTIMDSGQNANEKNEINSIIDNAEENDESSLGAISIEVPATPLQVSAFTYSSEVSITYEITEVTYKSEYNFALGEYATYIYISGIKVYDKDGDSSNENTGIHWKIYDANDNSIIIDSGTYLPPNMCVGEKFIEERIATFDLKKGKSYKLVFYDE